jgi:G:T/U-mismatch repair DNA glycosylase
MEISGELLKYGEPEINLVSLSVKRYGQAPSWKAEFVDGTNEEIVAEDIQGLTILKWKVDKERMKTLTKQPYRLSIHGGSVEYATTISFSSAGRDFSGQALLKVVALLVAGH